MTANNIVLIFLAMINTSQNISCPQLVLGQTGLNQAGQVRRMIGHNSVLKWLTQDYHSYGQ